MKQEQILKAKQVDLLSLLGQHTSLKRVASTNGGEYAGPCPVCGGRDRFRAQPNNNEGGLWFCRNCTGEVWQDAIAFQRFISGQGFGQAVDSLTRVTANPKSNPQRTSDLYIAASHPNRKWQNRAWKLIHRARKTLFECPDKPLISWQEKDTLSGKTSVKKLDALTYLHSRGLNTSTIGLWNIGFIPTDWYDDPKNWGLKGKRLWIPQGILIPCFLGDVVWYLKIRRPAGEPKYIQIRGSQPGLFMIQTLQFSETAVITEGELDALLLWQHVEDLAGVISLGSATTKLDVTTWGLYFLGIKRFFTTYDDDLPGHEGRDRLNWLNPQHLDIPKQSPHSKDLTDFFRNGGNLRKWFEGEVS